ncbi:hypothetical protein ACFVTF_07690 [Kitasatospora sp. NPDC057940]|uniref:phosphorylase family protein n=1 Tax=Kitasatospora sp. NPDC057940 TaxID=3346285 RepID=UPI0036D962FD
MTVLTTLPVMYQALLGQLDEVERWPVGAREFVACGRLAGTSWRVAPVLVGGYDRAAAVIAERVGEAEPTALFFADLVNCLEDDLALGDVVVATEVHHELAGPYSAGLGGSPPPWQPPVPLVQDASAALTDGRWRDRIAPGVLLAGRPAVHFEPIVSGGAPLDMTVGEVAGEVAERLSDDHRDAVAVDDGRAGSVLAYLRRARQALVVCGVGGRAQDAGQAVDADGSRSRAAAAAAAAVSSVIAGLPPRQSAGPTGDTFATTFATAFATARERPAGRSGGDRRYGGDHYEFNGVFTGSTVTGRQAGCRAERPHSDGDR